MLRIENVVEVDKWVTEKRGKQLSSSCLQYMARGSREPSIEWSEAISLLFELKMLRLKQGSNPKCQVEE
jgi:hypothetical protein